MCDGCDALVFDSPLMELALEYKWDTNVWPRLRWRIAIEVVSLFLCSGAMAASSIALEPLEDDPLLLDSTWLNVEAVPLRMMVQATS